MSEVRKNLLATGLVLAGVGAVIGGLVVRDHQDLGSGYLTMTNVDGLVASREGAEVPADKFFSQMVEKLKQEYVDTVEDEQKLASGSVRGMIASLNDPNSLFMDQTEFKAYQAAVSGHYEGIGAELSLEDAGGSASTGQGPKADADKDTAVAGVVNIPKLTVVGLTPNGPAAKAGVKVGDFVEFVNGRWLIEAAPIIALRKLQAQVDQKKAPAGDLIKMRKELRAKVDKSVLPLKARDELMLGESGSVDVVWRRQGQEIKTTLTRSKSELSTFGPDSQGVIHLTFAPGEADRLKSAAAGKQELTIDLRNAPVGDFATMKQCLSALAPRGDYGTIELDKAGKSHPLTIGEGPATAPKLKLLVDNSTRGVAEIFALALKGKGLAEVVGGPMAGHRYITETVALPDGSGYTLVVGKYRAPAEKSAAAPKKRASHQSVAELYEGQGVIS